MKSANNLIVKYKIMLIKNDNIIHMIWDIENHQFLYKTRRY